MICPLRGALRFLFALVFPLSFVLFSPFLRFRDVGSLERPFLAIFLINLPSDGLPHHPALALCVASIISPSFLLTAFLWYWLCCLIRILVPWNQGVGCILVLDNCWNTEGNFMKWQGDKRPFSTWCHPVEATCNAGVVFTSCIYRDFRVLSLAVSQAAPTTSTIPFWLYQAAYHTLEWLMTPDCAVWEWPWTGSPPFFKARSAPLYLLKFFLVTREN